MKDIININQAKKDIKELDKNFKKYAKEWEYESFTGKEKSFVAYKELKLVLNKMNHYKGFIFEYNESEYTYPTYGEWYQDQHFSQDDLYNCNVTEDNYGIADAVACDLKNELILYLQSECQAQKNTIDELLTQLINIVRADERYQTKCEVLEPHPFDKDLKELCADLDIEATDGSDASEKTSELINNICKQIKEMII